jgi:glycosyltransferase involved in cell wall biosynthesis
MKISFIITSLGHGGAEAMLHKVLSNLDRSAFQPEVVTLIPGGQYVERIRALDIPVHEIDLHTAFKAPWNFVRLALLLRRSQPEVVSTWMYHADLLGGLAARLAGIKVVLWNVRHSDLSPNINKPSTLRLARLCARLSATLPVRILSCSSRAIESHIAVGYRSDRLELVPNGFDLDAFRPDSTVRAEVRAELGIKLHTPLVGMIGRFSPTKNHFGFLTAAHAAKRRLPDIRFLFAGAGVDGSNEPLVRAIRSADLEDCVSLLGPRSDIPRLMASLDVLALPSSGEAFPNVVGEAMACGVPCVVTDVGDAAEIVASTGRVVSPGDMSAFAEQMVELLEMPHTDKLALGERARSRVAELYDIKTIVGMYERCYVDALGNRSSVAKPA